MNLKDSLLMPKTDFEMRGNLGAKEPLILARWQELNLYKLILEKNAGRPTFILHDGPPYANGDMHAGHMLNRNLKDIVLRMKAMQGYNTPFIFGWDTHGLPIENQVTKSGVNRKELSVAAFRELCEKYAYSQVERQKAQIKRLGVIGDFDNAYLTLTPDYEASQLEVFKKMALKGYIYRGLKPVSWSPSSETALAEAEIEYKDVTSDAIYVTFAVVDGNETVAKGTKFMIWTTTPWTLPANLAISVHPTFEYGLYDSVLGKVILLVSLEQSVSKETGIEFNLIKTFPGKALEGILTKHPLFDRNSVVICGEHVTREAGTGQVHTAPGHGMDDYIVGQKYGLDVLCPVDGRGFFTSEGGKYEGLFYEKANPVILEDLKNNGVLVGHTKITHSYPHDWRTNKPLIFRATPQWFASIEPIRQELLNAVHDVTWYPSWGETRMVNMIKDRGDWTISRQRAWGVPLPIIYHEDGTPIIEEVVFDKIIAEVKKHGSNIWFLKDAKYFLPEGYSNPLSPHGNFTKEKDIMDVWFDSGTSALHVFNKHHLKFPADLYLEGNDQYRGWFNSSLTVTVASEGMAPYKSVLTHGFVLDEEKEKMSKSKGNGLEPIKLANELGADILRLWSATIDYQEDVRLGVGLLKQTSESYRKIRNTFKFMLGNLPQPDAFSEELSALNEAPSFALDLMLVNKTKEVSNKMIASYNNYEFSSAFTTLLNFITNELSSLYLDIAKDILYCESESSPRRKSVVNTLYFIVNTLLPLIAPVLAFTAEEIYSYLPVEKRLASVHLLSFPEVYAVDAKLLEDLNVLLTSRSAAYLQIEELRKSGVVGSSQEVKLTLVHSEVLEKLFAPEELARIYIVSKVEFSNSLKAEKHNGVKCPRCWNYHDHLVASGEHEVCERCAEVLKQYEE